MDLDVNTLRIGVTVAAFALFIALILHSWSRRRLPEHAAAAMLPFVGEAPGPAPGEAVATPASPNPSPPPGRKA